MPVDESNISDLIKGAWDETLQRARGKSDKRKAEIWVDCLAEAFQGHYKKEKNQRVFWVRNPDNKDFLLNELLFDISVCKIEEVPSIRWKAPLLFVTKCYWQVESELNDKNSREITKDFSKLVMGQSDNKLFVSSYIQKHKHRKAAETLFSSMASNCQGKLYLCFVPHPRAWDKKQGGPEPELLKWVGDDWKAL